MHSYEPFSANRGANGPAGPQNYAEACVEQRAHFLNRLENAFHRLGRAADRQGELAMAMVGPWPTQGSVSGKDAPQNVGVFGAVEDIASAIHRVCDRMEEANQAVADRLP